MKLLTHRLLEKRISNRGGASLLLTAVFAIWAINKGEGWRHDDDDDDADLRFFALGDGSDERTWNRKCHERRFHDELSSLLLPLLLLGSCLALVLGCVLRRVFFQRNGTTKKNNPETRVKAAARPLAATALLGLLCVVVAPTAMAAAMPADGSDMRDAFAKIRRMEQLAGGLPEAGVSLPLVARGSRSELATLGAKEHAAAADFDAASALERICHRFVEGRSSAEVLKLEKNARTETPPLPLRTSPTRRRKDGAKRPVSGGAEDDEAPEAPWAKWVPNRSDRRRLSTLNVYNESDLQAALSDSTVTYITLTDDIYLDQVYNVVFFIYNSVTIDGGDGQRTLGFASSATGNGRIFEVKSGTTLTLKNLQLVNGYRYKTSGVASVSAIDCFLVVLGCISHALPS